MDHPAGNGAVTVEASYINISNCTQAHNFSELAAGDDAQLWYISAGYLLPGSIGSGRMQPYFRYEAGDVDNKKKTVHFIKKINFYTI